MPGHWDLTIAGLSRRLPVRRVAPDVSVAYFQAMGDVELCEAVARGLVAAAAEPGDVVVGPELKAVVLAHEVARLVRRPYVVLRKQRRAYLAEARSAPVRSVTSGGTEQRLWLSGEDAALVAGRRVWLVDDVLTTGSSLAAARELVVGAGAVVTEQLVVLTEGSAAARRDDVRALGHLPLFDGEGEPTDR
jgi:adenine phosphoribosyltransferase